MRFLKKGVMIVGDKVLPLVDVVPEFDIDSQTLVKDGFEVLDDKVVAKYSVHDMEKPQSETKGLEDRLNFAEETLLQIMMEG